MHEGWVHLGTTLNGMAQPICTFLSKGAPSSTVTQEGLAIIAEIFAFASFPGRVRRTTNRVNAVSMAEEGANFFDVYQFYREQVWMKKIVTIQLYVFSVAACLMRPVHQGFILQQRFYSDL